MSNRECPNNTRTSEQLAEQQAVQCAPTDPAPPFQFDHDENGLSVDDLIPYRMSHEKGEDLADVCPKGFVS